MLWPYALPADTPPPPPAAARCAQHPDTAAAASCHHCGRFICARDFLLLDGRFFCVSCGPRRQGSSSPALRQRRRGARRLAWLAGAAALLGASAWLLLR